MACRETRRQGDKETRRDSPTRVSPSRLLPLSPSASYWRSLEELAGSDEFQAMIQREFPEDASVWLDPVGRRQFLKLMAASLAFAGLSGCTRQPPEKIVPQVRMPEQYVPGRPRYFATAMPTPFGAEPVLVESHM